VTRAHAPWVARVMGAKSSKQGGESENAGSIRRKHKKKNPPPRDSSRDYWDPRFRNQQECRVDVKGYGRGVLRYYGPHFTKPGYRCGVQLDDPVGLNNGIVGDCEYFRCEMKHGILVDPRLVMIVKDSTAIQTGRRSEGLRLSVKRQEQLDLEQNEATVAAEEKQVNLDVAQRRIHSLYENDDQEHITSKDAREELVAIAKDQMEMQAADQRQQEEQEKLERELAEAEEERRKEEEEAQQRELDEAATKAATKEQQAVLESWLGEEVFENLAPTPAKENVHPMLALYSAE